MSKKNSEEMEVLPASVTGNEDRSDVSHIDVSTLAEVNGAKVLKVMNVIIAEDQPKAYRVILDNGSTAVVPASEIEGAND